MKKFIPILLLAFVSQMSYADGTSEGDTSAGDDKDKGNHPNKAPRVTPHISCNQGVLSVSTRYTLYDAEIIIRDIQGAIFYDVVDTISGDYAMLLPEYVSSNMQSVELKYSGRSYIVFC